jgi:hypothetical protein
VVGSVEYIRFGSRADFPNDPASYTFVADITGDSGECPGILYITNRLSSEGQIVGYIFDDFNGDTSPGPGAAEFNQAGINVYVVDCDTGAQVQVVQTGPQGWFIVSGLVPGRYRLNVDGGVPSPCFKVTADDKDRWDFDNLNDIWYFRGDRTVLDRALNNPGDDRFIDRPQGEFDTGGAAPVLTCTPSGAVVRFDRQDFVHPGGSVAIDMRGASSGNGTLPDPFLALYSIRPEYDPVTRLVNQPCLGFIAAADNTGVGLDAQLELTLPPGTYWILATAFDTTLLDLTPGVWTYQLEINR